MPNIITISRIILTPFIILILEYQTSKFFLAFFLFVFGALSDLFDGILARKNNNITYFGRLADPIADKIFTLSLLGYLVIKGILNLIPFTLLFVREFAITYFRLRHSSADPPIATIPLAKAKTAIEMVSIGIILLLFHFGLDKTGIIANLLVIIVLILSIVSGARYIIIYEGYLRKVEGRGKKMEA